MKIFVVFQGEDFEGGHNLAIFTTKEHAAKFINEYIKIHPRGNWEFDNKSKCWRGGCSYLEVREDLLYDTWEKAAFWREEYEGRRKLIKGGNKLRKSRDKDGKKKEKSVTGESDHACEKKLEKDSKDEKDSQEGEEKTFQKKRKVEKE
jgi:hypothetical protein